jgi:hypothetical protein
MGGSVGGILGGIAGGVGGFALSGGNPMGAMAGYSLGSGLGSAIDGPPDVSGAYADAASQQAAAAQRAADMAQFRPIGVTTGFGASKFDYNGQGILSGASYELTPELKAIRDRALAAAGQYNPEQLGQYAQPLYGAGAGLLNLGQQYLAQSPEQAAAQAMAQRQGLLAPGRAAEDARLAAANYGRGTGGLGVNTGTGSAPANPLAQALYNARAQQDAELAAQADLLGQQRTTFGSGLLTSGAGVLGQVPTLTSAGYAPLTTQLGMASTVEGLGQQALDIGSALGQKVSTAGANAGQSLLTGSLASAQTNLAGNVAQSGINAAANTSLMNSLGGVFGSLGSMGGANSMTGSWFDNLLGNQSTASLYNTNPYSEQTRQLAAQEQGFWGK